MKKILIVEDELAYIKLLHDRLTNEEYQVIDAEDGKQGLRLALKHHPDLIILDIKMPVMDGMTMLSALRKDRYGKTVKVIMLTNLEPSESIVDRVVKDQPTYYLVKSDVKLDELIQKVKELVPSSEKKLTV